LIRERGQGIEKPWASFPGLLDFKVAVLAFLLKDGSDNRVKFLFEHF